MKANSSFLSWLLMPWSKQAISPQLMLLIAAEFFIDLSRFHLSCLEYSFLPPVPFPSPQTHSPQRQVVFFGNRWRPRLGRTKKNRNVSFTCWTSFWNKFWFTFPQGKTRQVLGWCLFGWSAWQREKSLPLEAPYMCMKIIKITDYCMKQLKSTLSIYQEGIY